MSSATAFSRLLWAIAAIVLFLFALLAVNQNRIALRFLRWETPEISVFWWLLAAFLLGVACASLGYSVASLRARLRQRTLNRQLDESRRELQRYRSSQP